MSILCGVNLFPKRGYCVSKTKGNTLGQGSPVVSASLRILNMRIPLVLAPLPDYGGDRESDNSKFEGLY